VQRIEWNGDRERLARAMYRQPYDLSRTSGLHEASQ
jgi:hypothetical protein